jgi:hypothetical protein
LPAGVEGGPHGVREREVDASFRFDRRNRFHPAAVLNSQRDGGDKHGTTKPRKRAGNQREAP